MKVVRRKSRVVNIGGVRIGGNNPVAIQSMAKERTSEAEKVLKQINCLKIAGCEIVRLAVLDLNDARAIKKIKKGSKLPIVADIHFDWRLAMEAIRSGADKIRLNPGNIFRKNEIREIASAAKGNRIPIRVGVNSGSLEGSLKGATLAERMVSSALNYARILEGFNFRDIVVSLKASNTMDTVEAYRKIARVCDYPLHLGVTATGSLFSGLVKSSVAIGALLLEGIGDTIRVSLTDRPEQEVKAAKDILESAGLRKFGPEIISCPTCGRCQVDLISIVKELESKICSTLRTPSSKLQAPRSKLNTIAIMGCVVNGPGEAKEADIGIAFGKKDGLLFKKGRPVRKVNFKESVSALLKELKK